MAYNALFKLRNKNQSYVFKNWFDYRMITGTDDQVLNSILSWVSYWELGRWFATLWALNFLDGIFVGIKPQ